MSDKEKIELIKKKLETLSSEQLKNILEIIETAERSTDGDPKDKPDNPGGG